LPAGGGGRFGCLVRVRGVHNKTAGRTPPRRARLYRPLPGAGRAERAPGDAKIARRPVFQYDGRAFMACVNEKLIETGAELADEPLDAEAHEALIAMREILDSPELAVELTIQRGQVQLINNR